MNYLIGIDVGTSSTKTVLYDENLNEVFISNYEYPLYQPQNGWAEQDANDWSKALIYTIKDIVNNSMINIDDICGIGITGQMHGLVMLDFDNNVIRPSIIWADQRTTLECLEITNKIGKDLKYLLSLHSIVLIPNQELESCLEFNLGTRIIIWTKK